MCHFLAKLGWRVNETLSLKTKNIRWESGAPVSITIEKEFRKNRRESTLNTIDSKLASVMARYVIKEEQCRISCGNKRIMHNSVRPEGVGEFI